MRRLTVPVIAFAALASAGSLLGQERQAAGHHGTVLHRENVRVETRDGVELATDVFRPTEGGRVVGRPLPALLHRTPYDRTRAGLREQARYFASHGYVVVLQDTRGRYASGGEFRKYNSNDAPDGHDAVEWVAALPYVADVVGMWGTSYGAHTQADAAKTNPPHLGTIVPNMGGIANGWTHKVRNHGALELAQQLGWAFSQLPAGSEDPVVRERFERVSVVDWFDAVPFRRGLNPLSVAPNFEDYFLEMQTHGDYDSYWKRIGVNWEEYYQETADIPMLHVGGWYDSYAAGTVQSFQELARLKDSSMHLIMGPWTHGQNDRPHAGDVAFGPEAALRDFDRELHLRWFDHHLKGEETEAAEMSSVRIFVMGTGDGHRTEEGRIFHGGYWREASAWPLPEAEATRFYFRDGGGLARTRPTADSASTTYRYDPRDPVPTIGGAFSGALEKRGPFDQREREFVSLDGGGENGFYGSEPPYLPLSAREDVLVFQTEPLERDVEVVGPIVVRLYATSSAVDTDFTVKLVDVYPPTEDFPTGFDMNLTDGIVRARYRESRVDAELMEPGTVYEFRIEPFPTANVFKEGHRIRIDISSSNFPRFDRNPNTGAPVGRGRRSIPADNTVFHDAQRPSHVVLPLIPREIQ